MSRCLCVILSIAYINSQQCFFVQGGEDVPPRPPLPQLYNPDEHPPAVPPLPRETTVIRHTSVRGLKRQSDERKRDREVGQFTNGDSKVQTLCVFMCCLLYIIYIYVSPSHLFLNLCLWISGGVQAFPEWSGAYGGWRWRQPHQYSHIWTWWLPDIT